MKRLFVILFAGGFLAAACGSGSSSNVTDPTVAVSTTLRPGECNTPADAYSRKVADAKTFTPATPGTLVVGTSLPAPGFWNGDGLDPKTVSSGFEYDLARRMQSHFGLKKLVVTNVSVDDILQGTLGNVDVALSQIAATCRLVAAANMSMPYLSSSQGVLVTKKFTAPMATAEDVKAIRWGTEADTAAVDALERFNVQPTTYSTLERAYAALKAGKIDAVLTDTGVALGEASTSHGALRVIAQTGQINGPDLYTVVLPKSAAANTAAVNGVLQELQQSGKISQLAKNNLTVDPATLPLIPLPPH
jgi:polar amino acid transport system substrate-binding protein